jgi:fucose permease
MAGYLVGTSVVHEVHGRFGRRGASALTALPHLVALTLLSTRPTYYPVLLAAYFSFGMGTGCSDASFCTWAAGLAGHAGNKISGLIHGSYSAGCVMGPVVVALLERWELLHQQQWFIFYRIMVRTSRTQ